MRREGGKDWLLLFFAAQCFCSFVGFADGAEHEADEKEDNGEGAKEFDEGESFGCFHVGFDRVVGGRSRPSAGVFHAEVRRRGEGMGIGGGGAGEKWLLLFDDGVAEAVFAVVKDGGLAGGDALVFFGEGDLEASVGEGFDLAGFDAWAVADFGLEVEGGRRGSHADLIRLGGCSFFLVGGRRFGLIKGPPRPGPLPCWGGGEGGGGGWLVLSWG